jgi:hypothetical protein
MGEEKWAKTNWLEEGKRYNFTVEKGVNNNNLLVDFEIDTSE